jgi:hypothetical protein
VPSASLSESAKKATDEVDRTVRDIIDKNDQRHAQGQDQQQRDPCASRGSRNRSPAQTTSATMATKGAIANSMAGTRKNNRTTGNGIQSRAITPTRGRHRRSHTSHFVAVGDEVGSATVITAVCDN